MTIAHPAFKTLTLDAEYHPAEQPTGESGYSMGDPGCPANWEVSEIHYKGQDVTNFCFDFCDYLFSEFGEDLLVTYPNGLE